MAKFHIKNNDTFVANVCQFVRKYYNYLTSFYLVNKIFTLYFKKRRVVETIFVSSLKYFKGNFNFYTGDSNISKKKFTYPKKVFRF